MVDDILKTFCYFSRQRVNVSKSQVFVSPSTPQDITECICNCLGLSKVGNLGFYLGMTLLHERATVSSFDFIINKIQKKNIWLECANFIHGRVYHFG